VINVSICPKIAQNVDDVFGPQFFVLFTFHKLNASIDGGGHSSR